MSDDPFRTGIRDTAAQDVPLAPRHRPWRRRALAALALAALLGAGAAGLQWWQAGNQPSVGLARLTVAPVQWGPLVRDIVAEGRVVAANSPTLFAANPGRVQLQVKAGDAVTTGQVLAVIDSPELQARLAQERSSADSLRSDWLRAQVDARQQRAALQSAFENSRIDQQAAQNDLARQTQAFDAGAVARIQVDQARDTLDKARLAHQQAQAGLGLKDEALRFELQAREQAWARQQAVVRDLERQVAELSVRSPVDGQVGQLLVDDRASIARDSKLMTVVDLRALAVEMRVAESFARELAIGMPGEIQGQGLAANGQGPSRWPARISAISPEVVGGEVATRLRFDGEQPGQLRQNQRLTVRVLLDRRERVLTLPRGAFAEGAADQLYVLRDGLAQRRRVQLGARALDKVEVLSGLSEGEQVVINGAELFGDATEARVRP